MLEIHKYCLFILIGVILFYCGHEIAIYFELNGNYDGLDHRIAIATGYTGILMGVIGLIQCYLTAEKQVLNYI